MAKKRTKPAPDTEVVSLRVPTETVRALDEHAKRERRTRSNAAVVLLQDALAAAKATA